MDLFQVIMGFEFTKSELEEFYCIFGKLRPQANILHYSPYTQLVRSEKYNKKTKIKQQQQLDLLFTLLITHFVFQHYLKSSLLSPLFFSKVMHEDKCELVMVDPIISTK